MRNNLEQQTTEEQVLGILYEADRFATENDIKPSEFWVFRERVRQGYELPECSGRWENPIEYIRTIEGYAKERDIVIRPKHEFQQYFDEHPDAGAVAFSEDVFGILV